MVITNQPGSLGSLTTVIGKADGNITNLKITNRSVDFFEMMVDVEVNDVRHLSNIIAALRATPHHSVDRRGVTMPFRRWSESLTRELGDRASARMGTPPMILGIGNDIIDIRRMEKSIERFGDRFVSGSSPTWSAPSPTGGRNARRPTPSASRPRRPAPRPWAPA